MIIAVDFDGVLHTGDYPIIGSPLADARAVLQRLHSAGHYIILWTCRNDDQLLEAINWLLMHEIPFNRINDNSPDNLTDYGKNTRKVYADVYVDDHQVGGLPSWLEIERFINKKTNINY